MIKLDQARLHIPVFVGSTYEDLRQYRAAVRDTLHQMETIVRGMEYFGSRPESPKQECLKAVQSCKAYIGIFAMRYGSIDEETGKSVTHLEYEEARRLGMPILVYLIDEENQPVLPKYVETGDNAKLLQALKKDLKNRHTVSFFTTPEDLAKRVAHDLPPILKMIEVESEKEGSIKEKRNFEILLEGIPYIVPLELREVIIDNKKQTIWCSPLRHTVSGVPVQRDKFSQMSSMIKLYFKKEQFRPHIDELIKEGLIYPKG